MNRNLFPYERNQQHCQEYIKIIIMGYSSTQRLDGKNTDLIIVCKIQYREGNGMCVCVQSCLTLQSHGLQPMFHCQWDFPGKNIGAGCHLLLHWIFLTQGSNLHSCVSCIGRQILYHYANWEASAVEQKRPNTLVGIQQSTENFVM